MKQSHRRVGRKSWAWPWRGHFVRQGRSLLEGTGGVRQSRAGGGVARKHSARSCSIIEILNSGLERGLLQTAEEVWAYLAEEKASWNR